MRYLITCVILAVAASSRAVVIDFDDLPGDGSAVPTNYMGLTWGTSTTNSLGGNTGYFAAFNDPNYSSALSGDNYVYNVWGADQLKVSFPNLVDFDGAAFAKTEYPSSATEVRITDNLGRSTPWLSLRTSPRWLAANLTGVQWISIERRGASSPLNNDAQWYGMDNLTYSNNCPAVPEPASIAALGCGSLALLRRRRKS